VWNGVPPRVDTESLRTVAQGVHAAVRTVPFDVRENAGFVGNRVPHQNLSQLLALRCELVLVFRMRHDANESSLAQCAGIFSARVKGSSVRQ
jgi:hypothetical protein